ncbi:hypothetical protein HQ524_02195 [Candidatus Uhrbacteria bacterium]|nr:hypothetical protein [Candidatus Uhrbacteria bacterium]
MNIIKKGLGILAGAIGVSFTLALALITMVAGTMYDRFVNSWLGRWLDSPFAYVSAFYHATVYHVCYRLILQMRVVITGQIPTRHSGKNVIFVPGIHPPLLLLIPYYYLVCRYITARLLVTMKDANSSWRHPFGILMGIPLKVMKCVIFLPRGRGAEALQASMAELAAGIRAYANRQRALTLHVDMSRPTREKIAVDRETFSRMLMEKYGIHYDLSWLNLTLFPRLHAFATAVETLPDNARVVFLFMGLDRPIWDDLEVGKLFGSTLRAKFVEEDIRDLKQQESESRGDWERRLTLFLLDHWCAFNKLQSKWQNVKPTTR